MTALNIKMRLEEIARAKGAALFGVADLGRVRFETNLLNPCYNTHTRGISVGLALLPAALAGVTKRPNRPYCEEYSRVNLLLDSISEDIAGEIESQGAQAVRIPASEVVDWVNLRGHLSHKLIGRYAGHGWIGRNILLVNPTYGARVRYVTVLTDQPLEPDSPRDTGCGNCRRCIKACPAHAIAQEPAAFDLRACFNKLVEFNEVLGEPHFICGVCVSACRGQSRGQG
jgi:epoxyqueuosine reductase QueG